MSEISSLIERERRLSFYSAADLDTMEAELADDSIAWAGKGKTETIHLITGASKGAAQPLAVCGQWVSNKKRQPKADQKVCSRCTRGSRASFSTFNQPRDCMDCGRRFADSASQDSSQALCPQCYEAAGIYNAHVDGLHRDEPATDCPDCMEAMPSCSEHDQHNVSCHSCYLRREHAENQDRPGATGHVSDPIRHCPDCPKPMTNRELACGTAAQIHTLLFDHSDTFKTLNLMGGTVIMTTKDGRTVRIKVTTEA